MQSAAPAPQAPAPQIQQAIETAVSRFRDHVTQRVQAIIAQPSQGAEPNMAAVEQELQKLLRIVDRPSTAGPRRTFLLPPLGNETIAIHPIPMGESQENAAANLKTYGIPQWERIILPRRRCSMFVVYPNPEIAAQALEKIRAVGTYNGTPIQCVPKPEFKPPRTQFTGTSAAPAAPGVAPRSRGRPPRDPNTAIVVFPFLQSAVPENIRNYLVKDCALAGVASIEVQTLPAAQEQYTRLALITFTGPAEATAALEKMKTAAPFNETPLRSMTLEAWMQEKEKFRAARAVQMGERAPRPRRFGGRFGGRFGRFGRRFPRRPRGPRPTQNTIVAAPLPADVVISQFKNYLTQLGITETPNVFVERLLGDGALPRALFLEFTSPDAVRAASERLFNSRNFQNHPFQVIGPQQWTEIETRIKDAVPTKEPALVNQALTQLGMMLPPTAAAPAPAPAPAK